LNGFIFPVSTHMGLLSSEEKNIDESAAEQDKNRLHDRAGI